jgi:hypothetical protein
MQLEDAGCSYPSEVASEYSLLVECDADESGQIFTASGDITTEKAQGQHTTTLSLMIIIPDIPRRRIRQLLLGHLAGNQIEWYL